MSEIVRARVEERLLRLRLGSVATRLDAILSQAARKEPTYLDFLDEVLGDELDAKQKKRVAMAVQIAHFPTREALEEFDFKFQPSVDQRSSCASLRRATSSPAPRMYCCSVRLASARPTWRSGSAAPSSRPGTPLLFITATSLIGSLAKAESRGDSPTRLASYAKPKLLIVDELGYLPFEKRSAHLFFQLVTRRYERGSMLITTNQMVTQWGQRLRRRDDRRRCPRPAAAPQPRPGRQGRELPTQAEEARRPGREERRANH